MILRWGAFLLASLMLICGCISESPEQTTSFAKVTQSTIPPSTVPITSSQTTTSTNLRDVTSTTILPPTTTLSATTSTTTSTTSTTLIDPATGCDKKPEYGDCDNKVTLRWYFDLASSKCKNFVWSGCGGVAPFMTHEECYKNCSRYYTQGLPPMIGKKCTTASDCGTETNVTYFCKGSVVNSAVYKRVSRWSCNFNICVWVTDEEGIENCWNSNGTYCTEGKSTCQHDKEYLRKYGNLTPI